MADFPSAASILSLAVNTVKVFAASDLPTTLVADKHYLICAPITITAGNELFLPTTGNIKISSTDRSTNTLTYTGTGTLFDTATTMDGIFTINNTSFIGNAGTSKLFDLSGSGFARLTTEKVDMDNWGEIGNLTDFRGGIVLANVIGMNNLAGLDVVNALFLGAENCFFQNFSDTGYDLFMVDADTDRVSITVTGVAAQPTEFMMNINSSFTGEIQISGVFAVPTGQMFNPAGLDQTSIYVNAHDNSNQPDSTTAAELTLTGNTLETDIPAAGAMVEIATTPAWIANDVEQLSPDAAGCTTLLALNPVSLRVDGNVNSEPANASKSLSARIVLLEPALATVTFTNGTNLINETGTALVDDDIISFRANAGTLPAELREDIIYFVVSQLTNSFQVAYTEGGAAITFTDDGSGTNTYRKAELHGSTPTNSIASSNPRDLIPQATVPAMTGSETCIVVINNDDATNITVNQGYQRYST